MIAVIERDGLLERANRSGDHLAAAITGLGHPLVTGVRGRGLLRAVTLAEPVAAAVADAALDVGFIVNAPRPDVLRLAPPLIITEPLLDSFVAALPGLLDGAAPHEPAALPGRRRPVRRTSSRPSSTGPRRSRPIPSQLGPYAGPRSVALLFDKPTLRTQASFSAAHRRAGRLRR